jgi:hypothetical protein
MAKTVDDQGELIKMAIGIIKLYRLAAGQNKGFV